jgi:hypothetical protein
MVCSQLRDHSTVQGVSERETRLPWHVLPYCSVGDSNQHFTYALANQRSFSQAWRKRPTLSYTRYMAQCCDAFDNSVVLTDQLIQPLIQSSELLSRVNDHFSYDDIDNSDVKGERMLDISVTNFLGELKRIRETAPAIAKGNSMYHKKP